MVFFNKIYRKLSSSAVSINVQHIFDINNKLNIHQFLKYISIPYVHRVRKQTTKNMNNYINMQTCFH